MENGAARLFLIGAILVIPELGALGFSNMLPEQWHFKHWPVWLQIPFGLIVAMYLIVNVWLRVRRPGKGREHAGGT